MSVPDWIKHMTGWGVVGGVIGPPIENYIRNNKNLDEEQKKTLLGAAIGTIGGGLLGYYVGEKVVDKGMPDGSEKKILSTIIGAGGGGVIGYFIGERLGTDKKNYVNKSEQNKEQEGGG